MKEYHNVEDEKIIEMIRQQDAEAMDHLMRKYRGMVKQEARKMYLIGSDEEDLIQEGMIGLLQAIRAYENGRDASFASFARICVRRQMYSAVTASNRKKHQPLNTYVSFDEPVFVESADRNGYKEQTVEDTIFADEKNANPEKIVLDREQADMIESVIVERLTGYEKKVLNLYLEGRSYDDIALELNRTRKAIDNAIQRIRRKFTLHT
ncbi:MAG: RNA polymerase sporulation sigma factor SigH [Lachnospiraceae bacterium]|nr:RNA polymerase sporulation sigma factor SigH [Lachnospiraceae bacterium]